MGKIYDLCVGNNYEDKSTGQQKTRWTRIGVMFEKDNGGFSIQLDAAPLTGSVQAFERKPKEPQSQQ